jgi:hypothetical protein
MVTNLLGRKAFRGTKSTMPMEIVGLYLERAEPGMAQWVIVILKDDSGSLWSRKINEIRILED